MSVGAGVDGPVAAGFEPVADAFAENLRERDELGAAFAAVRDGHVVVDIRSPRASKALLAALHACM